MKSGTASGPLAGFRVVEVASIGPGPFAAMMLADMGAEVLRVDRASRVRGESPLDFKADLLNRGRRSVAVDLKNPEGLEVLLKLIGQADAALEGFRPGVAERLGFGPKVCLEANPRLCYGRVTGWGRDGPLSDAAGHDINYVALAGILGSIAGSDGKPAIPLNLIGDFGGGGMYLAFGIVCALLSAAKTGKGQVVDATMVDGAASLATAIFGMHAGGVWGSPGTNFLDGGSWFYNIYACKDEKYICIGSLEPQFRELLVKKLGLEGQTEPITRLQIQELFLTRTQTEWCQLLEGTDACFSPVLSLSDAAAHPHNQKRNVFIEKAGIVQPAPAPRFSETQPSLELPPPAPGEHTEEALIDWGFDASAVKDLKSKGAVA